MTTRQDPRYDEQVPDEPVVRCILCGEEFEKRDFDIHWADGCDIQPWEPV